MGWVGLRLPSWQTWSSRDLSLGLETFRDSFLQVLVSVLVLKLRVLILVLVLEPSSLGLGLGLGTWDRTRDSDPWVEVAHNDTIKVLHPLLEKVFCPPTASAPVERIFGHSGLLMRANRVRMGDNWQQAVTVGLLAIQQSISCKFSCCCTVVISL